MAQYKCENCNALRDTTVCPKCGADTHPVEPSLDELAASMSRKAAAAEATAPKPAAAKPAPVPAAPSKPAPTAPSTAPKPAASSAPSTAPKPAASSAPPTAPKTAPAQSAPPKPSTPQPPRAAEPPRETPASAPQPPRPATPPRPRVVPTPAATEAKAEGAPSHRTPSDIVGLDAFHTLLDRGVKAVVICGAGGSGKSEIAYGYIRANAVYHGNAQNITLRATLRTEDALGATNPSEIWYQPIDHRRAFLDPSGEFFRILSPNERQREQRPDVTEADFRFMQRAVAHLAGIVLVLNLASVLDDQAQYPWKSQEEDLSFVLAALRWLRYDREARPPTLGFSPNVAQRVSLFPRIDKRVLVLFSKADQLTKYTNQNPLEFASKRLPTLHSALMTHARRFRYDFCHTMMKDDMGRDREVDPCGVLLPMNWMLEDKFRWLPFQLPTSWFGGGK